MNSDLPNVLPGTLPSYDEAAAIVAVYAAGLAAAPQTEVLPLRSAAGRILAAPVLADRDMPGFPRSTRDGYACRAAEINSHAPLRLAGAIRAGDTPVDTPLPVGSVWEIMTGAAVPPGADAVAMLEHVEMADGQVRLLPPRSLAAGDNVVPQGAEARAGAEVVSVGTRMLPAHIATAASCGFAQLEVVRRPRVAILTTGDELVSVEEQPMPGQIRNSNAPMLAALVEQFGGEAVVLPAVADTAEALDAALAKAAEADIMLLSGGVSAGKFDLVEPALARLGAVFHFTGAKIQPGKPVVFGEVPRGTLALPFFGLPGNPISSAATFLLFAAPVLAALAGRRDTLPRFAYARMKREVKGKPGLSRFIPAVCAANPPEVEPVGTQGSGDLAAFSRANCLLSIPEGTERIAAGEMAKILLY